MSKAAFKIFLIISLLFILDLLKPFGYFLSSEFIFLGLIVIALSQPLPIALCGAIFGAYCRDYLINGGFTFSFFEFPLLCLAIHYLRLRRIFPESTGRLFMAKGLIAALSLFIHILLNSLFRGSVAPFFLWQFFIQSLFLYYLLDYLLELKAGPGLYF